jgi:hypothetical protein
MYICYIDESGTSDVPGTSTHFILAGVSIPIEFWRDADQEISKIMARYELENQELHTAWVARKYLEQSRIPNFENLETVARRSAVRRERTKELLRLQKASKSKPYNQTKKNFAQSDAYVHLTFEERLNLLEEIASAISGWSCARLFAECIDKTYFDSERTGRTVGEQAFEQVVSRFQQYLAKTPKQEGISKTFGVLVHDNNQNIAKKHTALMRQFHEKGTLWTSVSNIIETPLFVDSSLTRMVQIADLCSYALRRYLENSEVSLFNKVFSRADMSGGKTVGTRHFTNNSCRCKICCSHR